MGWVIFEERTGRVTGYYKSQTVAKSLTSRHNNRIGTEKASPWSSDRADKQWIYCSYADYEGVLMGMKEPERKMWVFCRG